MVAVKQHELRPRRAFVSLDDLETHPWGIWRPPQSLPLSPSCKVNFSWAVPFVPHSCLRAQSRSRKPRVNWTKQQLTWTSLLGKWSMLLVARAESWLQPLASSATILMNSWMLALRWRARLRWVWSWLSGTDPQLSTVMDSPPSRPAGQIGIRNLPTGYPAAFSLLLRKRRDLTGMAFPKMLSASVWSDSWRWVTFPTILQQNPSFYLHFFGARVERETKTRILCILYSSCSIM